MRINDLPQTPNPFKLILISPENGFSELEQLPLFFEEGLEYYHLRKPFFNEQELRSYLASLPDKYHKHIVIHSFHHLSGEFQIRGIHFTEKERLKRIYKEFPSYASASFHDLNELLAWDIKYDCVFVSPVFDSISKEGYLSAFKKEELSNVLQKIPQEVIALGGIDQNNIKEVKEMGFKGAAFLGAIWRSDNPLEKFRLIKAEINKLQ
ncbi:MAG TPA: thiamine phosphate synthase [Cytophagales bacterium]|nr:thiamine phosphate synthase [Cytophagales bacterium]